MSVSLFFRSKALIVVIVIEENMLKLANLVVASTDWQAESRLDTLQAVRQYCTANSHVHSKFRRPRLHLGKFPVSGDTQLRSVLYYLPGFEDLISVILNRADVIVQEPLTQMRRLWASFMLDFIRCGRLSNPPQYRIR